MAMTELQPVCERSSERPPPVGQPAERPMVEVDASHRYGSLVVHEHVKFAVTRNEFVCICGPSGCGKTTLLDYLAGILKPRAAPSRSTARRPIRNVTASRSCSRSRRPFPG